jgi:hypothetical protein
MVRAFDESEEERAQRIARSAQERRQRAERRDPPAPPQPQMVGGNQPDQGAEDAAVAPAFTRSPAATNTGILDYNKKEDLKIFQSATRSLYHDSDELFGCKSEDFLDFMNQVSTRSNVNGWTNGILSIPVDVNDQNQGKISLIHNYGEISYEQIKNHEMSYIALETRGAQNTVMLHDCLMKSLNKSGRLKVQSEKDKYNISVPGSDEVLPSGALLLKIIIDKSSIDSNSVSTVIREQMTSLSDYIKEVKYDIEVFHTHVKSLVEQLRSRGGVNQDLTFYLFRAYKTVPGDEFKTYVRKLKDDEDDGTKFSPTQLMTKIETKYKSLVVEKAWNVKDESDEKIIALEAQLSKLKKSLKDSIRKGKAKKPNSSKKGQSNKHKNPKDRVRDPAFEKARRIKPPNPKTDSMIYQEKEWKWCGKDTGGACEMFVRHKPKDCFKLKKDQEKSKEDKKPAAKKAAIVVNEAQFAQMKNEDSFDFGDEANDDNDEMDVDN